MMHTFLVNLRLELDGSSMIKYLSCFMIRKNTDKGILPMSFILRCEWSPHQSDECPRTGNSSEDCCCIVASSGVRK